MCEPRQKTLNVLSIKDVACCRLEIIGESEKELKHQGCYKLELQQNFQSAKELPDESFSVMVNKRSYIQTGGRVRRER